MRKEDVVTPLERRLVKLESRTAALARADTNSEIEDLIKFLTPGEVDDLVRVWRDVGENFTLRQLHTHAVVKGIIARSSTRCDRYPLLWLAWDLRGSSPTVPHPWSAEAEIEALRKTVAMAWKRKGLALDLEAPRLTI